MNIAAIPDMQIRPGIDTDFVEHVGKYLVEKQPDVWVLGGDFWDMPSLSSYDKGKKSMELRRYADDIEAGNNAMKRLLGPLKDYNEKAVANHKTRYRPRMVYLRGNHEVRIKRAVEDNAQLEGVLGYQCMSLEDWEVYDFLEVVVINGVAFSHYFTSGLMGRPVTSAAALLAKKHMSCVAFHQQGKQVAHAVRADGRQMTGVICGSCYDHNEDYLGPQGNNHFRGLLMMHDVKDGSFDEMFVSLDFLKRRYEHS
jgi:hypothetical protein